MADQSLENIQPVDLPSTLDELRQLFGTFCFFSDLRMGSIDDVYVTA